MTVSKSQQKAVAKYNKANYDRLEIKVAKGKKAVIQSVADSQGESLNVYIKKALSQRIKNDIGEDTEL